MWTATGKGVKDYLQERGVLTQKMRDAWDEKWGGVYVPFHRIHDTTAAQSGSSSGDQVGKAADLSKRFTGGFSRVDDPLLAMINDTYKMVQNAENNSAMLRLFELEDQPNSARWIEKVAPGKIPVRFDLKQYAGRIVEEMREEGIEIPEGKEFSEDFLKELATVWTPNVLENGRYLSATTPEGSRVYYEIKDVGLREMFESLEPRDYGSVLKFMGAGSRMLRATVTLSPDYLIRNLLRDMQQGMAYDRDYTPADFVKGLVKTVMKDEDYQRFMTFGGNQANFAGAARSEMGTAGLKKLGITSPTQWYNVIAHLEGWREIVENASRVGLFSKKLKNVQARRRSVG